MHNKAWFGCFLRQVACKIVHLKRAKLQKEPQMHRQPAFSQSAPNSQKKATIPPLFRPWFPFSSQPYHTVKSYSCIHTHQYINLITNILTANSPSCSTSQITISLIANHRPFYHRPLMGTPIRQGFYRGAQYWDKPHRRYR